VRQRGTRDREYSIARAARPPSGTAVTDRFVEALDETLSHLEHLTMEAIRPIPDLLRFCVPEWGLDLFE
jgi:hypothetical protein